MKNLVPDEQTTDQRQNSSTLTSPAPWRPLIYIKTVLNFHSFISNYPLHYPSLSAGSVAVAAAAAAAASSAVAVAPLD